MIRYDLKSNTYHNKKLVTAQTAPEMRQIQAKNVSLHGIFYSSK